MTKYRIFIIYILVAAVLAGCSPSDAGPSAAPLISGAVENIITAASPSAAPSPTPPPAVQPYNEYDISLDINPGERTVQGIEHVKYINKTGMELEKIYFNIYLNAFSRESDTKPYFSGFADRIFQNGRDYGYVNILNVKVNNEDVKYSLNNTSLELTLNTPLKTRAFLEVTLQFEAYIPKINHRTGADDDAMWCGNFLPVLAVYDEYGWHREPYYPAGDPFYSDISNYTVKMTTPRDYTVIAPGSKAVTEGENKKRTVITAELVRDFTFVIGKGYIADSIETPGGVRINLYRRSDTDAAALLSLAGVSIDYYGQKLGSYPYHELNIVECGLFTQMGISYPQLILIDTDLLASEQVYGSLAYEIGRQWFGGIIGSNSIKEAWLDRGMSMFTYEGIFLPDADDLDEKLAAEYLTLQTKLREQENKTLLQDLSVYKDWNEYYNIQYIRAKLMIYSLKLHMGDEKFNVFLKTYYSRFAFKTVNKKDFIAAAEEAYGASLSVFFENWMQGYTLPSLR